MCLITDQKVPYIAAVDITVYKVIRYIDERIISLYQKYEYNLNKEYTESFNIVCPENSNKWGLADKKALEYITHKFLDKSLHFSINDNIAYRHYDKFIIPLSKHPDLICISSGFHYYETIERIKYSAPFAELYNAHLVRCTIPKESNFYSDGDGLGVSNRLIINEIIDNVNNIQF